MSERYTVREVPGLPMKFAVADLEQGVYIGIPQYWRENAERLARALNLQQERSNTRGTPDAL